MRRFFLSLIIVALVLTVASFMVMWIAPAVFHIFMPLLVLYFTVVTGLQHYFSLQAAKNDARTFIKVFLGLTVGTLFLHLIVLTVYLFTHLGDALTAKHFLIAFCIGYIVYLVFETVALLLLVRQRRQ